MVDKIEKEIKRLFAPIIAYTGWEDMVTEEMKNRIQIERFANPSAKTATDYEAMIYLHTASLATPLSREMQEIYSFLFSKHNAEKAKEIGVYKDRITEREQYELKRLKNWLYQKQTEKK